jgi:hypothetical protein
MVTSVLFGAKLCVERTKKNAVGIAPGAPFLLAQIELAQLGEYFAPPELPLTKTVSYWSRSATLFR